MNSVDGILEKSETLQDATIEESNEGHQRMNWTLLVNSINCLINKINVNNLPMIVGELVKLNLIRGAGVFCKSLLTAQSKDPSLTNVYASLIAIVTSKLPEIGKLFIDRLIAKLRTNLLLRNKQSCVHVVVFFGHLYNQNVITDALISQMVQHLILIGFSDSIEIGVKMLITCGAKLRKRVPNEFVDLFIMLRKVKTKCNAKGLKAIRTLISIRKNGFKDQPIIIPELNLLKTKDKITQQHELTDLLETKGELDVFKFDPDYLENEKKYNLIRKILKDSIGSISLQRRLYLNLKSSLQPEEAAKRLIQFQLGDRIEMCLVIIDCCVQQITYTESHQLIAQNLCSLSSKYVTFSSVFVDCFTRINHFHGHIKLRYAAKLAAHLLITDSIPWTVLSSIQLNEQEISSKSQAFIKNLFQELSYYMEIKKLKFSVEDSTLREAFADFFHRNRTKDTELPIDFFIKNGLKTNRRQSN